MQPRQPGNFPGTPIIFEATGQVGTNRGESYGADIPISEVQREHEGGLQARQAGTERTCTLSAELKAKSAHKSGILSANRPNKGQVKFVADTAKATGRSKRSVKLDKSRGEKIAKDVQKEISGTPIENSGVQLDALAKATPDEQREAVKAVNLGQSCCLCHIYFP